MMLIILKVYLVLCAISSVLIVGKERKPTTSWDAIINLIVLGIIYYIISL